LLERLERMGERLPLWLADQQVDVLRHQRNRKRKVQNCDGRAPARSGKSPWLWPRSKRGGDGSNRTSRNDSARIRGIVSVPKAHCQFRSSLR
jgi:hypothetical protein